MTSVPTCAPILPAQYLLRQFSERGDQLKDAGGWSDDADGRNHDAVMVGAVDDPDQAVPHILDLAETIGIKFRNASVIQHFHGDIPRLKARELYGTTSAAAGSNSFAQSVRDRSATLNHFEMVARAAR